MLVVEFRNLLIDDVVFQNDCSDVSLIKEGTFHCLKVQSLAVLLDPHQLLQRKLSKDLGLAEIVLRAAVVHVVLEMDDQPVDNIEQAHSLQTV